MSTDLPQFLEPYDHLLPGEPSTEPVKYKSAVFRHRKFPSLAHVLWWPSQSVSKTCIIFIPGNPGLVDWYTPFLASIHEYCGENLNILAHAFVGHTPAVDLSNHVTSAISLAAQVEHVLELVDAVRAHYDRVVVIGHSVGAWVTLQALKYRENALDAVFLLFPTITHIADTPRGLRLSPLFAPPFPRIISWLSMATRIVPDQMLALIFSDWPMAQRTVLRSLISSPDTVYATLTMAHDEMRTIKDLDEVLLKENRDKIHMYFAEDDHWVGKHKESILRVFEHDENSVKIVHGDQDIPHSFCINHGQTLAQQCYQWLLEGKHV